MWPTPTYAVALLHFWAVKHDGTGESVDFSRWLDAVAHQHIVDKIQEGKLKEDTLLRVRRNDVRLVLAFE